MSIGMIEMRAQNALNCVPVSGRLRMRMRGPERRKNGGNNKTAMSNGFFGLLDESDNNVFAFSSIVVPLSFRQAALAADWAPKREKARTRRAFSTHLRPVYLNRKGKVQIGGRKVRFCSGIKATANESLADRIPYYGESSHADPLTREFWAVFAKKFCKLLNWNRLVG